MMRSGFRLPAVGGGLWSDPEAVALAEIARRVSTPRDPRSIRSPFTDGSADYEAALRQKCEPLGGVFRRGVRGSDRHFVLVVVGKGSDERHQKTDP